MENRDKKKDELNKKQQNNTDKKNIEDMNETTNNDDKKNVEDITERKKTGKKLKLSNRAYNIIRYVALVCAAAVLIYASYSLTDSYLNFLHLLQHGFGITKQCCSTTMKQEVTLN